MNSIILIAKPEVSLERIFALLREKWQPYTNALGRLVVEGASGPVFVYSDQRVLEDYEESDRRSLESSLPNPRLFVVDYTDLELAKSVALYLAENLEILVDVDSGAGPMSGAVFAHHLREDPDWDWNTHLE